MGTAAMTLAADRLPFPEFAPELEGNSWGDKFQKSNPLAVATTPTTVPAESGTAWLEWGQEYFLIDFGAALPFPPPPHPQNSQKQWQLSTVEETCC